MPNKTVYFTDKLFAFLVQMSDLEYPDAKDDAVSKVMQDAVKERVKSLAKKHQVKIPRKLQEELKP
jgi:hypothetical protein